MNSTATNRDAKRTELALLTHELQRRRAERERLARAEAEAKRLAALDTESLLDFVPIASPKFARPDHLAPAARIFERIAVGERVRVLLSVPPQHGKSTLVFHGISYLLRRHPSWPIVFATYAQKFAEKQSKKAQDVALNSRAITDSDRITLREWFTSSGGSAVFTGVDGPLTGEPARVFIGDDLVKNREDADSPVVQAHVADWLTSVAFTRLPESGSAIIVGTRWNENDPIGQLERGVIGAGDWEVINLPYLSSIRDGRTVPDESGDIVLWPRMKLPNGDEVGWTVSGARNKLVEVGAYDAAAMYQGQPRPRGGLVFKQPVRCESPELAGARLAIGADPAGTDGPNSNHSVFVALAVRDAFDTETRERTTVADVLGVLRLKLRPEHAAPQVLAWQRSMGGVPLHIEATRDGRALGEALQKIEPGLVIEYVAATGDKFLRAQPSAAAWNAGRIRVPLDARTMRETTDSDLAAFVRVVTKFSGVGDREDDDVDALSHAWSVALRINDMSGTNRESNEDLW